MTGYLVAGVVFAFAAAVQPGPFQAYLLSQALMHGWRRTVFAALAPVLSDGPIIVLVLAVLTRFPAAFLQVVQIAGGVFLLYLAYGAAQTWRHYEERREEARAAAGRQNILKAVVVNLLNPNPYLGWSLVMGPLLLKAWHEAPAYGIALVAAFYGALVLFQAAIVLIFSAARSLGPRLTRSMVGVSAIALGGFGLVELWQGALR